MSLDPLLAAPFQIQIHVLGAVLAIVLGPIALFRKSRDIVHKVCGYGWIIAMIVTAASSFWISSIRMIGPFSVIHGLSLLTFWGLWQGWRAIRTKDIKKHQSEMRGLYVYALGIAGTFAFSPGRLMNRLVFPDMPVTGFTIIAAIFGSGVVWYILQVRRTA